MHPGAIVEKAIAARLDIIAVCDHNASENAQSVLRAAEGKPLIVLPGMEIASREEVHLLALFDTPGALSNMQGIIYEHLSGTNREEVFGCQAIVDDTGGVEGFNDRFLLGATSLSVNEIVSHIHNHGGLAIAAHIDRECFSIISQLGFLDADIPFDALEITRQTGISHGRLKYPELSGYAFIESSDAHVIDDIGKGTTTLFLERGTIDEIKMAFGRRDGRYIQE
jgi:3',5'-nucleoside bisphosphate phosphatase